MTPTVLTNSDRALTTTDVMTAFGALLRLYVADGDTSPETIRSYYGRATQPRQRGCPTVNRSGRMSQFLFKMAPAAWPTAPSPGPTRCWMPRCAVRCGWWDYRWGGQMTLWSVCKVVQMQVLTRASLCDKIEYEHRGR